MQRLIRFLGPFLYIASILGLFGFSSVSELYTKLVSQDYSSLFTYFSFLFRDWRLPFFFLLLALLYRSWMHFRFRNTPLTVLTTHITLRFEKSDGSYVHVFREQTVRANQPNVKAYYTTMTPRWGGTIARSTIESGLSNETKKIFSSSDVTGHEATGWQLVQTFDPAVPYTPFFPFIPRFLFKENNRYFQKYVLKRHSRCYYENDFIDPDPYFSLKAERYTHHEVEIILQFDVNAVPPAVAMKAQLIDRHGVSDVAVRPTAKGNEYMIRVLNLRHDELRISWKW